MEILRELARIVSKNKLKRIEIVGHPSNYASNIQRMYEGIVTGELTDDESASAFFYNGDENGNRKYRRLKGRLQNRLLNTLFFIDVSQPGFNDPQRAYYTAYKDFAALKILQGRWAQKSTIPLAEKILKKALEFEFTDLAVNALRVLRSLYGSRIGDFKKYQHYSKLFHQQKRILEAEDLAGEYYYNLAVHFVKSRATKRELLETAREYAEEIREYEKVCNTQRFILQSHSVYYLGHLINSDYEQTISVCERAIKKLQEKSSDVPRNFIAMFLVNILSCNIQLRRFEEAEQNALECLTLQEEGTPNWYVTHYYYLLLLFHSKQYQRAFDIYKKVVTHASFSRINDNVREQWTIYEAYIHLFVAAGKIKISMVDEKELGKFRLAKFLNEVPEHSKDKRGANISILTLQVIFLVMFRRYDEIISRLDALKAYSHRYLKKDETIRSNCFIRMLMLLPKSYFNRKVAIRKTQKYTDLLGEYPLEVARQSIELELVPYEHLWELVLKSLKG